MSYKLGSSDFVIGNAGFGSAGIFGAADVPAGAQTLDASAAAAAAKAAEAKGTMLKYAAWGLAGYAAWYFWMRK